MDYGFFRGRIMAKNAGMASRGKWRAKVEGKTLDVTAACAKKPSMRGLQ
jgi:hypothetical protein